jgi:hypothetical protein
VPAPRAPGAPAPSRIRTEEGAPALVVRRAAPLLQRKPSAPAALIQAKRHSGAVGHSYERQADGAAASIGPAAPLTTASPPPTVSGLAIRRGPAPPTSAAQAAPGVLWDFGSTALPLIQPKLFLGRVDDPLEREADRVADAVLSGSSVAAARPTKGRLQRKCSACEEDRLQRKCAACEREEHGEETIRRAATQPA